MLQLRHRRRPRRARARALLALSALVLAAAPLSACSADAPCPAAELSSPARPAAYAVALSDYASSAVALLDADGELLTEAWIDSGTRASGISAGLRGDVALPDALCPGRLAILERWNADLLTLAALETGAVTQIDLRGDDPASPTGHSPNAQDALRIDARRVIVSRANPSFHPRAPELALGNDVVVVDLDLGRVATRIDLAADSDVPAPTPEDPDAVARAYARPGALVLLERGATRRVIVGLQRVDLSFRHSAPAAIAVLDPDDTGAPVVLVELPGLLGCAELAAITGAPDRALALCTGDTFAPEAERRPEAGLVRLALDETGRVEIDHTWRAADHPEAPAPTSSPLALDAARALFVSDPRADGDGDVDRLVLVDLEDGGAHEILLEAEASFVLGAGTFDLASGLLLVPDAHARVVHRWRRLEPLAPVAVPTCRTLPPREITRLAPD